MSAGDEVGIVEMGTHANSHGFFACIQMNEPGNFPVGEIGVKLIFKFPNQPHPLVKP